MENWSLRKLQTMRIVGTADPYRLQDTLVNARAHVKQQTPAVPRGIATWRAVGPSNVPGRISALCISRQNSQLLYAGSAAGGVFKTVDGGARWDPLWAAQESLAIGGLAVAPSDDRIVYAATG